MGHKNGGKGSGGLGSAKIITFRLRTFGYHATEREADLLRAIRLLLD